MRSSGGTKLGLARSVVACTKSRIACRAGPSFQDTSGAAVCACAVVAPSSPGSVGSTASAPSIRRRFGPSEGEDRMVVSFHAVRRPGKPRCPGARDQTADETPGRHRVRFDVASVITGAALLCLDRGGDGSLLLRPSAGALDHAPAVPAARLLPLVVLH